MNGIRTLPIFAVAILGGFVIAADPPKDPAPAPTPARPNDAELVERVVSARKEYQKSLISLYEYYAKNGDREREREA